MWFNFRACLISLTLSLVAATSLLEDMGGYPIAWSMVAVCIVVGLLRNGKAVDQPGIFIPISSLVLGFLLSVNGAGPAWRALETILLAAAGGLPWERRAEVGFFSALFETIRLVLLEPKAAFATMKQTGGLGAPLFFFRPA